MDPLTHTLVGANLAETRLGQSTRLAAAALIVGANLPDIDSILYYTGHDDLALGFRRSWTHGVLALLVLPIVQTALLLLWAKLRPHPRITRPWVLLGLSFFAILTHPFLDWLNNYGMRWLMPFRGTWSYGDSVYIMDPFLWLVLGCGWLATRRPNLRLIALWLIVSLLLAYIVSRRAPEYFGVIVAVAVILLGALLWRPKDNIRRIAAVASIVAFAYIGARLTIHAMTVAEVRRALPGQALRLMASPHPIDPRRWDVVAQIGDHYRYGRYTWATRKLTLAPEQIPVAKDSPEWRAAQRDPSIRGFMTWVRFPWYRIERSANETRMFIHDARYLVRTRRGGFGGVEIVLPPLQ
ncbi:MAG: metal-dependent hydrolase [Thermoanaerobaculia bacterium]